MNLEIVKLDSKTRILYKWPYATLLDEAPGEVTVSGIGVIETREIITSLTTKIIDPTRAVSVIEGTLQLRATIDLLNSVCAWCNNRATTITEHTFYLPENKTESNRLTNFKCWYAGSRLGAFTTSLVTQLELNGTWIIYALLTYPENDS